MKYIKFIFIILLINSTLGLFPRDNNKEFITRNIAVLPVYNSTDLKDNIFIKDIIRGMIKDKLEKYFVITNFKIIDEVISGLKYEINNITEYNYEQLSYKTNSGIIIACEIMLIDDNLSLVINVIDSITGQKILDKSFTDHAGFSFTSGLDNFINNFTNNLKTKLYHYNEKIIYQMQISEKLTENKRKLIENLINQKNRYWNFTVKTGALKKTIIIPFGKNIIIFIMEDSNEYIIEKTGSENIKHEHETGIIVISYENEQNKKHEYEIHLKNGKVIDYIYKQAVNYEIKIRNLKDSNKFYGEVGNYRAYIDNIFSFSTSGYTGLNIRAGIGLPLNSNMSNSINLGFFVGPKVMNLIHSEYGIHNYYPHLKFRLTAGYQHVFYIKHIMGINLGFNFGYEMSFFSFLVKDYKIKNIYAIIPGYPCFVLGFPVEIQFFSYSRVNFIMGFEPVLRFVFTAFFVDNYLFLDNLDESRDSLMIPLRRDAGNYLVIDLFFYDMPVYFAVRIKI